MCMVEPAVRRGEVSGPDRLVLRTVPVGVRP
jgi:hypothetical protein